MKMPIFPFFLAVFFLLNACRTPMENPRSPQYSPIFEIQTTMGNITVQLSARTPKHRDNFVKLVKSGFYKETIFHRVINNFMIQAGDPDSKNAPMEKFLGMGGTGYNIPAEFDTTLTHVRGALCAARMGDEVNPEKASSGSQFYIVQNPTVAVSFLDQVQTYKRIQYTDEQRKTYLEKGGTPHLDRDYTVFGMVLEGMDVVDKIAAVEISNNNRPSVDIKIIDIKLKK